MPQRRIAIGSGEIELEGAVHMPPGAEGAVPGVVICHPHPLYGGDMESSVVLAMCQGVTTLGMAALRFNFRGTGRSGGMHDGGKGEQEDALAALSALQSIDGVDGGRVGLAGYSFGASVALAAGRSAPTVRAMAVVAPPLAGFRADRTLKMPCLVMVGDADSFIPIQRVRAEVAHMLRSAELAVLAGADHFFAGYEDAIAERVGRFFAANLGQKRPD